MKKFAFLLLIFNYTVAAQNNDLSKLNSIAGRYPLLLKDFESSKSLVLPTFGNEIISNEIRELTNTDLLDFLENSKLVNNTDPLYLQALSVSIEKNAVSYLGKEWEKKENFSLYFDGHFSNLPVLNLDSESEIAEDLTFKITNQPIIFSEYVNRVETIYNGKEIESFKFIYGQLMNKDGDQLSLQSMIASNSISLSEPASFGNGAMIIKQGIFKEEWIGNGEGFAFLNAPTLTQPVSFTLNAHSNNIDEGGTGTFQIYTGKNNFSMAARNHEGYLGWESIEETKITLSSRLIETQGQFWTTHSIIVYDSPDIPIFSKSTLGYFASSLDQSTGLTISNSSLGINASSGIYINQGDISNWLGTLSPSSNATFSGAFMIKSEGNGGIILNATSNDRKSGIMRLSPSGSLIIGSAEEINSAIVNIESDSKGVVFPRLTEEKMRSMNEPQKGMIIFNLTKNKFFAFTGVWEELCSNPI